jgi:hypothetical protein
LLIVPSVFSNVSLSCVVSLDCPLLIVPSVFSNVYLSCLPYVTSVSGLSIVDCPLGILYRLVYYDSSVRRGAVVLCSPSKQLISSVSLITITLIKFQIYYD